MRYKLKKEYVKYLYVLLALVLAVACIFVFKKKDGSKETSSSQVIESTSALFTQDEFKKYKDINEDYIGNIIFESSLINEPVVYSSTNSYYLRRDINKNKATAGTVYMDDRNTIDDQNVILYGHHFSNKSKKYEGYEDGKRPMFSELDNLLEEENYEENKTVYLFLESEIREYVVVSVYEVPLTQDDDDNYVYVTDGYEYYFTSYTQDEFDTYKKTVKSKECYDTHEDFTIDDTLLTLQTCVKNRKDLREIVLCKLVNTKSYEK